MGNQTSNKTNKENANVDGHKVFLSLRCRDIILHYSYKMKLTITDISLFPHGLQGLRLWDQDVILSRYVILQNQKFRNKSAFVFKGGVGIVGISLSKWGGCKKIDMCDTRPQVVSNMTKNCQRNQVTNVKCFEVNLAQFGKYSQTYDFALATDLFSQGFQPHVILNIWRKVLKLGGESIMLMPDKKDQCKKLLETVDRTQFKIQNMLLTADQYQASPLPNKQEGESQFPQIGKVNFYVISLTKLREKSIAEIKAEQQQTKQNKKEQKLIEQKKVIMREEPKREQSLSVSQKQQRKVNPEQKLIQVPKSQKSDSKQIKTEIVKQQIQRQHRNQQKNQVSEEKTQYFKQEQKMIQMEKEKKMLEMAEEKKMLQMEEEKKMLESAQAKKMIEMEQQKKMLEMVKEKKAEKIIQANKTQQTQKQIRGQQIKQKNKEQQIQSEKIAKETQSINMQQQKQPQIKTKEQARQQTKQHRKQQSNQLYKVQENPQATVISTDKEEPKKEAKEVPVQNIEYNINEQEIVYDGYVPSQDQQNQEQTYSANQPKQQHPPEIKQNQKCQESKQNPAQVKQQQEHKQTNPEAL